MTSAAVALFALTHIDTEFIRARHLSEDPFQAELVRCWSAYDGLFNDTSVSVFIVLLFFLIIILFSAIVTIISIIVVSSSP